MTSALVLVDIQKDFWDPYKHLSDYNDLPKKVKKLRAYAQENGVPVIHIRSLFNMDRSDWMLFYRPEGRGNTPCIEGSSGAEFTEFAKPMLGETVITKKVFDSFNGTQLLQHLINLGVKTVLISGIETSVCVLFTATSAYLNRILPIVIQDACADKPERHLQTLKMYNDLCFKVLSTHQITEGKELQNLIDTYAIS